MNKKEKVTPRQRMRNLKINSRIVITSILAIIIPTIIIVTFAGVIVTNLLKSLDLSNVTPTSYSVFTQIQWSDAIDALSSDLARTTNDEEVAKIVKKYTTNVENAGSSVYIEKDGKSFYSTTNKDKILADANKIVNVDTNENIYHFSKSGAVMVSHAQSENSKFTIIIVNNDFYFPDAINSKTTTLSGAITNRTIFLIASVGLTFILAIIIISFITSKTIVGPIKKITAGANEISKGNLDYNIDYDSTNELGQLVKSFNEMTTRVKESVDNTQKTNQKQKEVIAGIAHDLRTPLTSIKGYVEGLKDGIADTQEKQERYINTIYNSTCDIEKMINDLLTISKLELGDISLNKEDVDVLDLVRYAYEVGKELSNGEFDFELVNNLKSKPKISVDVDKFSRVIDNIVSNSINYKKPNVKGKITLTLTEFENSVIVEIADNGMGVEPHNLSRIFETLYRADKARTNVSNGSGLGLSVCKQIVELHGGMIWAKSQVDEGLSIFISLPKVSNI